MAWRFASLRRQARYTQLPDDGSAAPAPDASLATLLLGPPGKRRLVLLRCVFGFCGMGGGFMAMQALVLSDASVIIFTGPCFTFLAAWAALGEPATRVDLAAAAFSIVGVACVARPTWLGFPPEREEDGSNAQQQQQRAASGRLPRWAGVAAGLFGAMSAAGAYTTLRAIKRVWAGTIINAFMALAAVLSPVCAALFQRDAFLAAPIAGYSGRTWLYLALSGVMGTAGQWALTRGFQIERAGPASICRYLDVVFVFFWDAFLLREPIRAWSVAGACVIVGCCCAVVWNRARQAR